MSTALPLHLAAAIAGSAGCEPVAQTPAAQSPVAHCERTRGAGSVEVAGATSCDGGTVFEPGTHSISIQSVQVQIMLLRTVVIDGENSTTVSPVQVNPCEVDPRMQYSLAISVCISISAFTLVATLSVRLSLRVVSGQYGYH